MQMLPRGFFAAAFMILVGLVGLYFGTLYNGTVCSDSGGCITYSGPHIQPLTVIVGLGFLTLGLGMAALSWRNRN